MKFASLVTGFLLVVVPAVVSHAQNEPSRLPVSNYGSALAAGHYENEHSTYKHHPVANCNCEHRKGYDLWCQPVGFLDHFRGSVSKGCCGKQPAPSCCAPEPTCAPPAPTCCAPEPTCAPPAPTCCAPEPTCAPPAPTCCAPEPTCGAPSGCGCTKRCKTGLFNHGANPLSDLHAKLKSLFDCKKCKKSSCGGCGCACGCSTSPSYFEPSAPQELPNLPESIDNPFRDDPNMIPAPETTTGRKTHSLVRPVHYTR